ncbi:hypothetical protein BV22DRAFT_840257 [Leucogyrophana mollusca]|uniref:Uncharacterized protein n=1 Tax=Leucogyrophana mollusca TaxID=85980 RepID=A0ACB8B2D7_9AGAM|nr:hypothetical protein BV22DRAFT_840257 [Leucogyrophana mollusca]
MGQSYARWRKKAVLTSVSSTIFTVKSENNMRLGSCPAIIITPPSGLVTTSRKYSTTTPWNEVLTSIKPLTGPQEGRLVTQFILAHSYFSGILFSLLVRLLTITTSPRSCLLTPRKLYCGANLRKGDKASGSTSVIPV